jgi:hypothetical protein
MKKLMQLIHDEFKYAVGVSWLIFVVVLFLMLAIAEYDIDQRLNHLEYRVNSIDPNIPYMKIE